MDNFAQNLMKGLAGVAIYVLLQQVGLLPTIIATTPSQWSYQDGTHRK